MTTDDETIEEAKPRIDLAQIDLEGVRVPPLVWSALARDESDDPVGMAGAWFPLYLEGAEELAATLEGQRHDNPGDQAMRFAGELFFRLHGDDLFEHEARDDSAWAKKVVKSLESAASWTVLLEELEKAKDREESTATSLDALLKAIVVRMEAEKEEEEEEGEGEPEDEKKEGGEPKEDPAGEETADPADSGPPSPFEEPIQEILGELQAVQAEKAEEAVESSMAVLGKLPGVGHVQDPPRRPEEQVRALMEELGKNPRFRTAIDQIGRLLESYKSRLDENGDGSEETSGIETGSDLQRVLPSKLAQLHHPVLRKLFLKDFAEKKMIQFERRGVRPRRQRGDVIIMCDESSSMDGEASDRAHAVAAALFLHAAKGRRRAYFIGFDDEVRNVIGPLSFSGHNLEPLVKEILGRGVAGGTSFDPVVMRALHLLSDLPDADLLLITDGAGFLAQATIDAVNRIKKTKGTRFFTFTVGGGGTRAVVELSDEVLDLWQSSPAEITQSAIFGR